MGDLFIEEGSDHIWYVDIEVTFHMFHDIESFKTYEKVSNSQVAYLGDKLHIKYLVKEKFILN